MKVFTQVRRDKLILTEALALAFPTLIFVQGEAEETLDIWSADVPHEAIEYLYRLRPEANLEATWHEANYQSLGACVWCENDYSEQIDAEPELDLDEDDDEALIEQLEEVSDRKLLLLDACYDALPGRMEDEDEDE